MARTQAPISVGDAVYRLQLSLLDGIHHENQLFAAGSIMSLADYDDVVTERSIARLCGYPLCSNPLPAEPPQRKGRYRISLKEHRVYDLEETRMYCSSACVVNSKAFAAGLREERCAVSDPEKISELLRLFGDLSLEEEGEEAEKAFSDLKIQEKAGEKGGEVALEDWIGPSNAIEGYITRDRGFPHPRSKSPQKPRATGSKLKEAEHIDMKKETVENEGDFTSIILIGNKPGAPGATLDPKKDSSRPKVNKKSEREKTASLCEVSSKSPGDVSMEKKKQTVENEGGFTSTILIDNQPCVPGAPLGSKKKSSESRINKKSQRDEIASPSEIQSKSLHDVSTEKSAKPNEKRQLKSAMKYSGVKTLSRNVTWADDREIDDRGSGKLCNVREIEAKSESTETASEFDDDGECSLRFSSAEACAAALSQAAEAVASGEDPESAVNEAGIVILPQPLESDEGNYLEAGEVEISSESMDTSESDKQNLKWPKKTVLDTDLFDTEDSWHDAPPEGFSLTLSPFATMWMTLFGWVSTSSLAYIYGRDESFQDEYVYVNGREYPDKVVLGDGRSVEIKQTLAGCIARSLPGVVSDFRLPTPVSSLEQFLGRLLDTMSYVDPLPPFRTRQWNVIVVLFLDALSVCRIPALTQLMSSRRPHLHKVIGAAQVSIEEYEVMKDFLIPLGRQPEFSAQSGG